MQEKACSLPLSGSGTAAALGGVTVFGLFTGTDFGIVFGAFAGALFVATMPQTLSAWRVAAHFLVSFIVGVLGARGVAGYMAERIGFNSASVDALCAVLVSVVSVKVLSFIHQQEITSLVSGLFSRQRGGGGGNGK
ncbi:putative holin [Escherichia coli]